MIMSNLQLHGVTVQKKIKVSLKINIHLKSQNPNKFQIYSKINELNNLKNKIIIKIIISMVKTLALMVQIHQVILKIQKRKLALLWFKILKKFLLQNEPKKELDKILQNRIRERRIVDMKIIMHFLMNLL